MFTVTAGGSDAKHPASFLMSRPAGLSEYVILLMKTASSFTADGQTFPVHPVSALFITPDTAYRYHSSGGDYVDDWLHFTCPAQDMEAYCNITKNRPVRLHSPAGFSLYIRQLLWEQNYAPESFRDQNVDMLMRVFLNNLVHICQETDCPVPYNPWRTRLQSLRLSIQAQPYRKYPPAELAASMGISVSYFQHLYTGFFGIPFQADLIALRLEYAKDLIRNTNLTMERIAVMCGYGSEVHFYRQFKKQAGMTPAKYRETVAVHES